ncbi:MAG TPA: class D sortase [Gaiellaceae bacterium]|jgi:sortase A|nr:class D sortase [Gaiellaceae bacterium]
MRRLARITGTLLVAAGALTLAWVVVVWRWQDPFTALYTHVEQSHLAHAYDRRTQAFRPHLEHRDLAALESSVAAEARADRRTLRRGDPVGRLEIGRIGLDMVVVQGTDPDTLKKGPGHYVASGLPGEGHLVYVAGHRTTYLAPFAHIDDIRVGDDIRFELPYGTFTYRVTRHYVVPADRTSVLRDHGRELLRLQACHPRFFATHRYIVDARLVRVAPRGGDAYPVRAQAS